MNLPKLRRTKEEPKAISSGEWSQRITVLEGQFGQAQLDLDAARAARRDASARTIVYNDAGDNLKELVAKQRGAEMAVENLDAAIQLARTELQRAEVVEEAAREAERKRVRAGIVVEIMERAARVDKAFAESAGEIRAIEGLFRDYCAAGGDQHPRMKVIVSRAARGAGLRDYISGDHVGDAQHCVPLVRQWAFLVAPPQSETGGASPELLTDPEPATT